MNEIMMKMAAIYLNNSDFVRKYGLVDIGRWPHAHSSNRIKPFDWKGTAQCSVIMSR